MHQLPDLGHLVQIGELPTLAAEQTGLKAPDSVHVLSTAVSHQIDRCLKSCMTGSWPTCDALAASEIESIQGQEPPERVLLVDAVPHDWLFPRVRGVVHHGGAGTFAAGLLAACPTLIVPFFGDQSFW